MSDSERDLLPILERHRSLLSPPAAPGDRSDRWRRNFKIPPSSLTHCSVPSNTVVIARPARREDEPTPRVGCRYPAVRDAATRRATIMLLRRPPAAGPIGKTRRASGPGKAGWLALQMASATVAAGRSLALHRADPYEHNRTPTSGRSA